MKENTTLVMISIQCTTKPLLREKLAAVIFSKKKCRKTQGKKICLCIITKYSILIATKLKFQFINTKQKKRKHHL